MNLNINDYMYYKKKKNRRNFERQILTLGKDDTTRDQRMDVEIPGKCHAIMTNSI